MPRRMPAALQEGRALDGPAAHDHVVGPDLEVLVRAVGAALATERTRHPATLDAQPAAPRCRR